MKSLKLLILALITFIFQYTEAQIQGVDNVIGKNYSISSKTLNQVRDIQIYLPDAYKNSNTKYPVLYILDGQWHFTNGVAIQKALRVPDLLPEMIVVGIITKNPLRRQLMGNTPDKFLQFIEEDVIAFVESTFRTSKERILFGWESAAFFSNYALLDKKQLFDGAIITNGAYASEDRVNEFSDLKMLKNKILYIANSEKDIYYVGSSNSFSTFLKEQKPNNLHWKYQKFNDEIHESLAYLAMYHGLRYYFHDFKSLVFSSIKEFEDLGGISYLKDYFKTRGERYGFPTEIDKSTKHSLIWLAWNHDNFEAFTLFMTAFKTMVETNKSYDNAYWKNRFGQFYLKHHDVDNAILYFIDGIEKHSDSKELAEMYAGLGTAYSLKTDRRNAIKNLIKAIAVAKEIQDDKLGDYEMQLKALKAKKH